ncbi:MAG: glycosyltransferase family 2 protein [Xenococcaceae cyanobacterium MO_207.B15]|nr:glycosyltransferase family 2 protein [Xenococcaceae cyanobacterium MO_207.B15]MDJ0747164.1 glycosyltransferase family 2 protein [Xenococcaceae cyanobacterium MO_167.B27]
MKTPVALLIFNRPDTTEKVFEAIRQAKPPKLLVVADGPRSDRPDEAEKCEATRAIIDRVDWECEVLTNYSEVNKGCKLRVSSGLDWVFNNVEEAIILEDDCLAHPTFFRFCEELLDYYRNDTRIMHINGNNHGISGTIAGESYHFSKLTSVWGWASWRRAWQYYDVKISFWTDLVNRKKFFQDHFKSRKEFKLRSKIWNNVYTGKIDTWDYQWYLSCICQSGLAIMPNQNLISNIGFDLDATHTADKRNRFANLPTQTMQFPLIHPKFMLVDTEADELYFNQVYRKVFMENISRKLIKSIKPK